MHQARVIDVCSSVPTRELFLGGGPNVIMSEYRKIFGRGWAKSAQLSPAETEQLDSLSDQEFFDLITRNKQDRLAAILGFLKDLDEAGVRYSAIHNVDEETTTGAKPVPNDYIAEIVREFPDRFIGFIGVDPHKGRRAVSELERAAKELGLRGVVLRPFAHKLHANDRLYYPIYERCVEMDIPVWIHTSFHWWRQRSIDFGRPVYLDQVAGDFPELKIIAGHGGWPWINEMVAVAWRHANVYVDFSAHRPRYLGVPGTGWDMFLHFGNSVLQDKIVFGSDGLVLGMSIKDMVEEVRQLPLKDEVKEKWLWRNAARIFALEP